MGTAQTGSEPHVLQCMEVWGGHAGARNALSVAGLDAWVLARPHRGSAAGGDIYYVSTCGRGRVSRFSVVDAAGHGPAAASLAGRMRQLMRKHVHTVDQRRMAKALNRELAAVSDGGEFATALLTSYFPPTDDLIVCNAGHPWPLWYRAERREWTLVDGQADGNLGNLPLGVVDSTDYTQFSVRLGLGDLVVLYTDALIEARDVDGQELGHEGLLRLAAEVDPATPHGVAEELDERLRRYRGGRPLEDDELIIVLHHNGAEPQPVSVGQYARAMADMMGLLVR